MLTPEQIKKLIEIAKPEGFRFTLSGDSKLGGGYMEYMEQPCSVFGLYMPESIMYPLFLQKCIEGVNRGYRDNIQDRYFIDTDAESIDVWDEDDRTIAFCGNFRDYGTIDHAKEHALIYILENIKGHCIKQAIRLSRR